MLEINNYVEQKILKNKKIFFISILVFFSFLFLTINNFELTFKKETWGFLVIILSFFYSKNTLFYHFRLKKLLNIINKLSKDEKVSINAIKDLLKFRKFFITSYHSYNDRLKIEGSTMDFIAFFTRYLLILLYLKEDMIKNIKNIDINLIEMKFISDRERNNSSISIYSILFNDKHLLTYLLPYKYSNNIITEMINLLLTNKIINYSFLKKEGASQDDINYCKNKLGEWWTDY